MQTPTQIPHSWREAVWFWIAIFITWALGSLTTAVGVAVRLLRREPRSEIHLSEARAELILAQADDQRIRTKRTSGEIIDELNALLAASAREVRELETKLGHKDDQIHVLEEQIEMINAGKVLNRNEAS